MRGRLLQIPKTFFGLFDFLNPQDIVAPGRQRGPEQPTAAHAHECASKLYSQRNQRAFDTYYTLTLCQKVRRLHRSAAYGKYDFNSILVRLKDLVEHPQPLLRLVISIPQWFD